MWPCVSDEQPEGCLDAAPHYTSLIIYHIVAEINDEPSSNEFYFIK